MSDPLVAIVIPIFKQPSLVIEAVESALRQEAPFDYRVVLVNDGCPFAETDEVCQTYARAHPDKVRYVRRRNGGLSAARNSGVEAALALWPSVQAVQVLDADDRLGPRSLAAGYRALESDPEARWAYPGCRRIGFAHDYVTVRGPWSSLELMAINYVMCASMIRRSVFEAGLRYDENMRLGYEDWDFWIQCAESGWRGIHAPEVDFQYRQRGESMLADTARQHEQVFGYMRRKHAALYSPRRAIELEHSEIPRYALFLTDRNCIRLTSDPLAPGRDFPFADLPNYLARYMPAPKLARFPHFLAVTSQGFLDFARSVGVVGNLFWHLQTRLETGEAKIAAAVLSPLRSREVCLELTQPTVPPDEPWNESAVAMTTTRSFHEPLLDPAGAWFRGVLNGAPEPAVDYTCVRCAIPASIPSFPTDAMNGLVNLVDRLGEGYRVAPRVDLIHGKICYRQEGDTTDVTRRLFNAGPLYPSLLDRSRIQIGYGVPICEFGGAERVTLNFGRESRRRGWRPHLFVIGSPVARLLGEFKDVFESINVVPEGDGCKPDRLLGLLGTMDVVVNNNCVRLNDVYSLLKRQGVRTVSHIHSVTIGSDHLPSGQPYETVKYEHSIDAVVVISQRLHEWCRAWGIPEEKLVLVPNSASFEISDALVETTMIERAERTSDSPLNILFLGRFDLEKGLDRLLALYEETLRRSLPARWQIVGRSVVHQSADGHGGLERIASCVRPPVHTATGLSHLYRWADVVIMLSRFEGVPLTILEAQRLGCVVLSTHVGAIGELVETERTGFLFSNDLPTDKLVDQMIQCLEELRTDRGRLLEVAKAGVERRRDMTWRRCFEPFARTVEAWLPGKIVETA